jgi:hypothetical protein
MDPIVSGGPSVRFRAAFKSFAAFKPFGLALACVGYALLASGCLEVVKDQSNVECHAKGKVLGASYEKACNRGVKCAYEIAQKGYSIEFDKFYNTGLKCCEGGFSSKALIAACMDGGQIFEGGAMQTMDPGSLNDPMASSLQTSSLEDPRIRSRRVGKVLDERIAPAASVAPAPDGAPGSAASADIGI